MPPKALSAARCFQAFKIRLSFSSLSLGEPAMCVNPFSRLRANESKRCGLTVGANRYLWQREALKKEMPGAPCHAPENCASSGAQAKRDAKSLGKPQILLWRHAFCHRESRQTSFLSQPNGSLSRPKGFLTQSKGF